MLLVACDKCGFQSSLINGCKEAVCPNCQIIMKEVVSKPKPEPKKYLVNENTINKIKKEARRDFAKEVLFLLWPNPREGVTIKQYNEWLSKEVKELLEHEE